MKEQWIIEMQQKLADYRQPAPEVSWDLIEEALAKNRQRAKAKMVQMWTKRIAAAVLALVVATMGYRALNKQEATIPQLTEAEPVIEGSHCDDPSMLSVITPQQESQKVSGVSNKEEEAFVPQEEASPIPQTEESSAPQTQEPQAQEEEESPVQVMKDSPRLQTLDYPTEIRKPTPSGNRLMAKVYMSSAMTGDQTDSYGRPGVYNSSELSTDPLFGNLTEQTEQYEQYVNHHQPVRFGLSLRYRLKDRWNVESGLTYTRLSSDITTIIDDVTTVTEQRLNYIGLPLNISCELWKSRYFGLYVTGGGMIEKRLDDSSWQFSLNGAAGAEYKLTNFFSLYAEPGIGYYFKDGSSTPTIYKDHPLNFNLSFGLRLNLK